MMPRCPTINVTPRSISRFAIGRAPEACLLRAFSVLVAGILGWAVLQAANPVLRMPKELAAVTILSPPEKVRRMMGFRQKADLWNPIMAMGLFGAAVGGSLAVGRVLAARSKAPLMLAAILGVLPALRSVAWADGWVIWFPKCPSRRALRRC